MSDIIARQALERLHHRAVAISPQYSAIASDLKLMYGANAESEQEKLEARRIELCAAYGFNDRAQTKPFAFADGIALIPIHGSLINRFGSSWGFVTGYQFIRRQFMAAMADDDVKGIVFDVNSNGGEAAGCFELAEEIRAGRETKPSVAFVDSNCYSAGYALASAAGKVVCTPSGGVGSIGVVAMHVDMSKLLEDFGVKVTFITFGEHKVDGNPYEALSPEVQKDIQKSVNKSGEAFVSLVAANRNMDAKKVRDTEARVYRAEEAKDLGLIDTVASSHAAMQVFYDELSGSTSQLQKEDDMSTQANTEPGKTQATAPDTATLQADARKAERARVAGITGSEEAKGRSTLANHLAMNTEMSVDDAKAILAASPAEKTEAAAPAKSSDKPSFKEHMDKDSHPNVGTDAAGTQAENLTPEQQAEANAARMFASFNAEAGRKPKTA